MRLLGLNTISIIRRMPSSTIRGIVVNGDVETLTIKGSLQPESNLRVVREVFGAKVDAAIKIYSETRLKTYEEGGASDYVMHDDKEYEVSQVRHYSDIIPHYKIIAILRKDER